MAPLCTYLDSCEIVDPDAGNCSEAALSWLGCGGSGSDQVNGGLMAFDPVQGQSCLDALASPGGCGDAVDSALLSACATVLLPNVPLGGNCAIDQNCLPPPDASYGDFGPAYGCDVITAENQLTCLGQCAYGYALGQPCASGWNGAGCVEGQCGFVFFSDGGGGQLCVQPATGSSCTQSGLCSGSDVCGVVEDAGYVCQTPSGVGTLCDLVSANGGVSTCAAGLYCLDPGDGGPDGVCTSEGVDGGGCLPSACQGSAIDCACDVTQSYCLPQDGGTGICAFRGGAGTPCDSTWCPTLAGCACVPGLQCAAPGDGGAQNVCQALGGVGAPCSTNSCSPPTAVTCQCDSTQSLYCASASSTCQPQLNLNSACSPADSYACGAGLNCGENVCIGASPLLGEPCAPNNNINCGAGQTCSDTVLGICVPLATLNQPCSLTASPSACGNDYQCVPSGADGGVCAPLPALGDDCAGLYTCRQLLSCLYIPVDGGSNYQCDGENGLGGACDPNNDLCLAGYCDPATSVCVPFLALGTPCSNAPANACGAMARCNSGTPDGGIACGISCPGHGG